MDKQPNKLYEHKGYNVNIYYGDKKHDDAIKEIMEFKTNEHIKKLAQTK